jgi:serine/threonine-protein kinase HipA
MAVGNTRHYVLHTIAPRHFVETAKASKLPVRAETILDEVADAAGAAMDKVLSALPKHFPQKMANSIRQGALLRRDLLVRQ